VSAEEIVMRIHIQWEKFFATMSLSLVIAFAVLTVGLTRLAAAGATNSITPTFLPVVTYDSGGFEASSVVIADVNGDGKPDLVVVNCGGCYGPPSITHGGSLVVMLGNCDGTFQTAVAYGSGGQFPLSVAVADVNGDGKPDLVVANGLSESLVGVLLGNGDGTFQPPVTYGTGGLFPSSVAVADVNGDGSPDVLVGSRCAGSNCNGSVGVLLGRGDGTFQAASTYPTGGNVAFAVAVADVNGDGKPDLLVAVNDIVCAGGSCSAVGAVAVLLGHGDGTFQSAVSYGSGGLLGFFGSGGSVAVADVNKDGKPDLVVENNECCNSANGSVGILLGNGDGTFKKVVTYKSGAGGPGTSAVVADVNGDGKPDLVVTDQCAGSNCLNQGLVGVLLGNGDGTFQPTVTYSTGGFLTNSVAVADLNGDGEPDLVVANQCADNSDVCARASVGVLLNNTRLDVTPPAITLSATPKLLWPPNGKMVPVTISGTITDAGSGVNANSAAYSVKDEYDEVQSSGAIMLGPSGNYSMSILLQASRLGTDTDGRRYTVTVRASDHAGNSGSKMTVVNVPHDQGR
jgi:hypothetical protein